MQGNAARLTLRLAFHVRLAASPAFRALQGQSWHNAKPLLGTRQPYMYSGGSVLLRLTLVCLNLICTFPPIRLFNNMHIIETFEGR